MNGARKIVLVGGQGDFFAFGKHRDLAAEKSLPGRAHQLAAVGGVAGNTALQLEDSVPSRFERGFSASENPPAMGRHAHRRATPDSAEGAPLKVPET